MSPPSLIIITTNQKFQTHTYTLTHTHTQINLVSQDKTIADKLMYIHNQQNKITPSELMVSLDTIGLGTNQSKIIKSSQSFKDNK